MSFWPKIRLDCPLNPRFEGGHGKDGGATNAVYRFTENFEYQRIGHLEHERTLHRSIRQG